MKDPSLVPVLETILRGNGTLDHPMRDVRFEGLTFAHATWWVSAPLRATQFFRLIYTLSAQPDAIIQANHFHNQINDFGGIYLDQGSRYFTITNNVVSFAPYWFLFPPQVPPPAQDNELRFNFTDTARDYCCGGLGCCTDFNNVVSDNTIVTPGAWPAKALSIMRSAGIEDGFLELKGPVVRIEAEDYDRQ